MTPEKQRIAIAEWCGWKLMNVVDGVKFSDPEEPLMVQRWVNESTNQVSRKLPDYLDDLNAIHEAEDQLRKHEIRDFEIFLIRILGLPLESTPYEGPTFPLIHATAAQRCEALLRTIGKWQYQQKAPTEAGAQTL